MKRIKFAIFCCILSKMTLSAPVSTNQELIEELEKQVETITETIKLLKVENFNNPIKRQASTCILNGIGTPKRYQSCKEIYDDDKTAANGLYAITPNDNKGDIIVYCDMMGGGWTIIQRRKSNGTDFFKGWQEYKLGFGRLAGDFWLGLESIHRITKTENHELLVTMVTHEDATLIFKSKYDLFKIDSSAKDYRLSLGNYLRAESNGGNSFSIHDNQKFSTLDRDNDENPTENCALKYHGGWWYRSCHEVNLNGRYYDGNYGNYDGNNPTAVEDGIVWLVTTGWWHSLKSVTMAIRPKN